MASLLIYRRGVYSAISEAYGSEIAALEATANDANIQSSLGRVTDFINEAGRLMARHGVALRGRRAAELAAGEVVELLDLDLIQSPPGRAGVDHCGEPWAAYRVGYGPAGALGVGGAGSALSGDLVVSKNSPHSVTNSVGGSTAVFTPFAFGSADLAAVWGGALAGPVFAGVSAGLFSDFGSLFFSVGYSGAYAFSARACGVITLVFSLSAPASLSGWSCASSVTVTARNASGVVVAVATQGLSSVDVGVNKTISLDAGGQSVASVTVSMSLESSWYYPGTAVNVAGFGVNFRRFHIVEVSGSGSAALPSSWLTPIDLAARERWRSVVAPGSAPKYWSPQGEGSVSLWPATAEDKTIFADALHTPIALAADNDAWDWVPVGGDRLLICFASARVCQIRSDDPRLSGLASGFMAEFVAGVERLREDVSLDVRHLFTSITGTQIAGLGK